MYFKQSWYHEFLLYRETVQPNFGTNQTSVGWVSDAYTAEFRSSSQQEDIASVIPAEGTNCGGSSKETADVLICMGAGVKSQDSPYDEFSNETPEAEQGQSAHALDELDLIMEQDKARTHQQSLDQESVSEERRRESEARVQRITAQERARVAKGGIYMKVRHQGLPLLLETHGGLHEIMTCYDTGTQDNHMSYAKAIELGYNINPSPRRETGFQLPNGKIIKAMGQVVVAVHFARQVGSEAPSMICHFNVFQRLALPVLIGMTFLQATETITKYTSRMVDLPTTWKRSLRLCAVGNAINQVACTIDGRELSTAVDTGPEIDLVSSEYAVSHDSQRDYGCEELELADGSLEYTRGFVDVTINTSTRSSPIRRWYMDDWKFRIVRFHSLEHFQFDEREVFAHGFRTTTPLTERMMIPLKPIETSLAQAGDALGKKTTTIRRSSASRLRGWLSTVKRQRSRSTPGKHELSLLLPSPFLTTGQPTASPMRQTGVTSQARANELPQMIIELDQAENRRLDQIERRGTSATDDIDKQRYTDEREKLILELRSSTSTPASLTRKQSVA